jgi:hypothetical protein
LCASDGSCRSVKGSEKAIPCRIDLSASISIELFPDNKVMLSENFLPSVVADLSQAFGRINDIGEEHRGQHAIRFRTSPNSRKEDLYLIQERIGISFPDHMIIAGEFNVFGSANAQWCRFLGRRGRVGCG